MRNSILLVVVAWVFASASPVIAQCDCLKDLFPEKEDQTDKAYSEADLVFYGQVIAVRKVEKVPDRPNDSNYEAEVFFSIEKVWKKDSSQVIKLRQSLDGCIRNFNIGHRWLIYGYEDKEGFLRTGYCHPNKRADQKPELDMEEFQKKGLKESRVRKNERPITITLP